MEDRSMSWPEDAAVVVALNVAWENWQDGRIPEGRVDVPLVPAAWRERGVPDRQFESWQEYANGPAMRRLQDLLVRHEVPASGLFSGLAVERCPDVCRRWVDAGLEVVGHGWDQEVRNYMLARDDEAEMIIRCRDVIRDASGVEISGWLSPGGQPSASTVDTLVELGFLYCMDFANDDVPYIVERATGTIVAIPHQYDVHDIGTYARFRHPPSVFVDYFRTKFDTLYAEGIAGDPKVLTASVHAHLFGHPFGSGALEECIRYAKRFPRVWFATKAEIARWTREHPPVIRPAYRRQP